MLNRALLIKLLGLVLVSGCITTATAQDDAEFTWRDVEQTVNIEPNGNVRVRDTRTLTTDADFGEAFICLNVKEGQVTLLEGGAVDVGPSARAYSQPCADGSGGTELVVKNAERVNERRIFFDYRIKASLNYYRDVVQWYWKILEDTHPPVDNYSLTVFAPGPMSDPFDAYVHRHNNPEVPSVELSSARDTLRVHFNRVPEDNFVEVRYLMNPALFAEKGSEQGFEALLRDETRIAQVARLRGNPLWSLLALLPLAWLLLGISRARRRFAPPLPAMRYPFEPPAERAPAFATYMASKQGASASKAFSATIMDLARRGYGQFASQGKDFNMMLSDKGPEGLKPFERDVLDYLRRAAKGGGDDGYLAFKELKRYSEQHLSGFMSGWDAEVRRELHAQLNGPRLEPRSQRAAFTWLLLGLLAAALCFVAGFILWGVAQPLFFAAFVLCFGLGILAPVVIPNWRKEIAQEAQDWQGFKRTLKDYTRMKDAPDDFFKLWDVYYCYAAALGVAKEYLKNIERAAPEVLRQTPAGGYYWYGNPAMVNNLQSVSEMTAAIQNLSSALDAASASASSGGSSAGGGGGGGGGSSGGR